MGCGAPRDHHPWAPMWPQPSPTPMGIVSMACLEPAEGTQWLYLHLEDQLIPTNTEL